MTYIPQYLRINFNDAPQGWIETIYMEFMGSIRDKYVAIKLM